MPIKPSPDDNGPSAQDGKQSSRKYRWMTAICGIWFFGFFGFLFSLSLYFENGEPPLWAYVAYIAGSLFWWFSASWTYDALFTMAEARWPAVKGIREIVSPLIKALLSPHHK